MIPRYKYEHPTIGPNISYDILNGMGRTFGHSPEELKKMNGHIFERSFEPGDVIYVAGRIPGFATNGKGELEGKPYPRINHPYLVLAAGDLEYFGCKADLVIVSCDGLHCDTQRERMWVRHIVIPQRKNYIIRPGRPGNTGIYARLDVKMPVKSDVLRRLKVRLVHRLDPRQMSAITNREKELSVSIEVPTLLVSHKERPDLEPIIHYRKRLLDGED